ncbi:hypothetical protein CERZMDRAFT_84843 [Cercospora zeae-maydis SCOH1-5]|uniref:Uncharacterized protein n=1 Tax=Cercospora zeae-maydis SCOH1-5 TaxID=717836 RepID=A0A6A6FF40_9PEZI|nr:hypothetical protein CERZMDRAFT_84843 [Cercospora zeae-maydis SCOH1-5]
MTIPFAPRRPPIHPQYTIHDRLWSRRDHHQPRRDPAAPTQFTRLRAASSGDRSGMPAPQASPATLHSTASPGARSATVRPANPSQPRRVRRLFVGTWSSLSLASQRICGRAGVRVVTRLHCST